MVLTYSSDKGKIIMLENMLNSTQFWLTFYTEYMNSIIQYTINKFIFNLKYTQ
jgi:hypothetical protein